MDGRPQQRNPERRDADVGKAEQQERVAGVAEAEEKDQRHRMPEGARQRVLSPRDAVVAGFGAEVGVGR